MSCSFISVSLLVTAQPEASRSVSILSRSPDSPSPKKPSPHELPPGQGPLTPVPDLSFSNIAMPTLPLDRSRKIIHLWPPGLSLRGIKEAATIGERPMAIRSNRARFRIKRLTFFRWKERDLRFTTPIIYIRCYLSTKKYRRLKFYSILFLTPRVTPLHTRLHRNYSLCLN